MNKDELITKQQLKIEDFERKLKLNKQLIKNVKLKFYGMGQPLNDNILNFNKKQQAWCFEVMDLIDQLNDL